LILFTLIYLWHTDSTINYFVPEQDFAATVGALPDSITLSIHLAKGSFKDAKYNPIETIIAAIIIAVGILIFIYSIYSTLQRSARAKNQLKRK
jgi:hypothetical protein